MRLCRTGNNSQKELSQIHFYSELIFYYLSNMCNKLIVYILLRIVKCKKNTNTYLSS